MTESKDGKGLQKKQLTLSLPEDVYRILKLLSFLHGTSISSLVSSWAREEYEKNKNLMLGLLDEDCGK